MRLVLVQVKIRLEPRIRARRCWRFRSASRVPASLRSEPTSGADQTQLEWLPGRIRRHRAGRAAPAARPSGPAGRPAGPGPPLVAGRRRGLSIGRSGRRPPGSSPHWPLPGRASRFHSAAFQRLIRVEGRDSSPARRSSGPRPRRVGVQVAQLDLGLDPLEHQIAWPGIPAGPIRAAPRHRRRRPPENRPDRPSRPPGTRPRPRRHSAEARALVSARQAALSRVCRA